MEFKEYESKPVKRMAFQITADMEIEAGDCPDWFVSTEAGEDIDVVCFKAYQQPVVGDWIVRLTEDDTYHCTDQVFRERNVVP